MFSGCIIITGQMRSYSECVKNIHENLIYYNKGYSFDVYIHTEYLGEEGGSAKNKYTNKDKTYTEFKSNILSKYDNIKKLIIKTDTNYPEFTNNYGPYINLYRNYDIMKIFEKDYDVYIRIRPDIILTNPIKIINLDLKGKIHIICSKNCNNGRWLHSRDWDHMVICNKTGYEL